MRIDWIASDTLPFSSVEVPDVRSSDHRPIVADLVVGPGSASG
jgi:endonuclease/exonuclease/phosphatase (EEP) superfamily protein YafD